MLISLFVCTDKAGQLTLVVISAKVNGTQLRHCIVPKFPSDWGLLVCVDSTLGEKRMVSDKYSCRQTVKRVDWLLLSVIGCLAWTTRWASIVREGEGGVLTTGHGKHQDMLIRPPKCSNYANNLGAVVQEKYIVLCV